MTRGAEPAATRCFAAGLLVILTAGLLLRLLGIGWGLPGRIAPGEPPIHPDEGVAYNQAAKLYTNPTDVTFLYGGALYVRTAWLVRAAIEDTSDSPDVRFARTLLGLRAIGVAASLLSAVLVAWAALPLFGSRVALAAAALFVCFPNSVLDSHYARPDVLMNLFATGALACACRSVARGSRRLLVAGGVCAGLASATMLSGVIGFFPLAAAGLEALPAGAAVARLRHLMVSAVCVAAGGILGYAIGSPESVLSWDAFQGGLDLAARKHRGGHYGLPTALLGRSSLYAFGTVATLAGYTGLALFLLRRRPGTLTLATTMFAGYALLGRVGGDMMRHLLFVAAPTAIAAATSLAALGRRFDRTGRGRPGLVLHAVAIALTLQLSLSYVLPMQFALEPRYRTGRWLVENAPRNSRVGVTLSFYGDRTYTPRLPPEAALEVVPLMVRRGFDASRYIDLPLEFIVTTDFARERAGGATAPDFFDALFHGPSHRPVATIEPPWQPLSVPAWLGLLRPGDLLYVRPTFQVFERGGRSP